MNQKIVSYLIEWVVHHVIHGESDGHLTDTEADFLNQLAIDEVFACLYSIANDSEDALVRSRAFQGILALRTVDKVEFLINFFDETTDEDWKWVCCRAMSEYQDERLLSKLCIILYHDQNPDIRYAAAEGLGENGDITVIACLKYAIENDKEVDWGGYPIADVAQTSLTQVLKRIAGER